MKRGVSLKEIFNNIPDKQFAAKLKAADILGSISGHIIKKRADLKMSQKEFAELLDVKQSMISKYESGCYNFSIQSLCKLCAKLNMDLDVTIKDRHQSNIYQLDHYAQKNWDLPTDQTNNSDILNEAV